jgi:antitoxin (DNA-binding transcriptional repressor) of toxin-antitoxin stability system
MPETLTVTATEANRSFSRLMRKVREGAHIDITSHGETFAEIRPKQIALDEAEHQRRVEAWARHRAKLEARAFKVIGPWTRAELYERD